MPQLRSSQDILIQTERSDEARAFYEGVLGFAVVHDDPAMCGLDTGSFRLFIDPAPSLGPVFEFEVDDLAEIKARLLGAGCSVIAEDPAIPRCYLRDPFGLIFNLREVGSASDAASSAAIGQRFEQQNLGGAVFQDCSLARAEFDDVDLSGSHFSNVRFDRTTLTNVSLAGVTIDNADIAGLTIFGHDIQGLINAELARRGDA